MSEDHKQLKLDEVYRELATIKQQLHALMQPNGNENNSRAFVKINIMQPMSQMLKRQEPKEKEK